MFFRMLIEVGVAMFAAYGILCAFKVGAELLFPSQQIVVAIEVRTKEDADALDVLLYDAKSLVWRRGRTRTVVLLASDLMDGRVGYGEALLEPYASLIERYGAECYLIDDIE